MRRLFVFLAFSFFGYALAQTPGDVRFEVRASREPAVYHPGEQIELELRFSTETPGKYVFTSSSERRLDLGAMEHLVVSPSKGAVDPELRKNAMAWGVAGDFLSSEGELGAKPEARRADLNEWFRFERAGSYVVSATSSRVSLRAETGNYANRAELLIASNQVELTILEPDPAWEQEELQRILQALESPNTDEAAAAERRLRYLDTAAAAAEQARRILAAGDSTPSYEFRKGLLQASHPEEAIAILESSLNDGESPTGSILLLAQIVIDAKYADRPLPNVPPGDQAALQAFRAEAEIRQKEYETLITKYQQQLAASLAKRSGKELSESIYSLWTSREQRISADDREVTADLARLGQQLVSVAGDLKPPEQLTLLEFWWDRLPNQGFLPLVRKLAGEEELPKQATNLRDVAFRRWCELDPSDCEKAVIAEIRKPETTLQIGTLTLARGAQNELDDLLKERLEQSRNIDQTAALIEHYAGDALEQPVTEYLNSNSNNICAVRESLIAYLLRVNKQNGIAAVRTDFFRRDEKAQCWQWLLPNLGKIHYVPELSALAAEAVRDDSTPEAVSSAAQLLSENGPAAAEEAIWKRFAKWSEGWQSHKEELEAPERGTRPLTAEANLELALAGALTRSKIWTLNVSELRQVRSLCVTEVCRESVGVPDGAQ